MHRPFLRHAAAHPLVAVFVLALAVRLINLALLAGNDAFFAETDSLVYWKLGAALAKPESFWPTLVEMTDRMPLYPLLLGAMQNAFGDTPRLVALVQAVIDAGTCALIATLGALVSPRVGLIAGILASLSVTLIVFSTQLLTETLFLFFFTSLLLAGGAFPAVSVPWPCPAGRRRRRACTRHAARRRAAACGGGAAASSSADGPPARLRRGARRRRPVRGRRGGARRAGAAAQCHLLRTASA